MGREPDNDVYIWGQGPQADEVQVGLLVLKMYPKGTDKDSVD